MIRVICAMLTIANEDLELRWSYSNLLLGKSAIRFEPPAQKGEIDKQTAGALYY